MQAERVKGHIVNWLRDYLQQSGAKGFVIGISGGIDSAVSSALAAETGAEVLMLEMPIHQHESQVRRGEKHIEEMMLRYPRVQRERVELSEVFDRFLAVTPAATEDGKQGLARQTPAPDYV